VVRLLDPLLQANTVDTASQEDIPVSLPLDLLQASTVDTLINLPPLATDHLLPTIKDSSSTASNNIPRVVKHQEDMASNNIPPVAKHREVTASSLLMASNNIPLPDGTELRELCVLNVIFLVTYVEGVAD
jgi:hypothetical protein